MVEWRKAQQNPVEAVKEPSQSLELKNVFSQQRKVWRFCRKLKGKIIMKLTKENLREFAEKVFSETSSFTEAEKDVISLALAKQCGQSAAHTFMSLPKGTDTFVTTHLIECLTFFELGFKAAQNFEVESQLCSKTS